MEYYFQRYGDLELHRRMVGDRWRTDAFAAAIAEAVSDGDHVLDVGTGTGVLAMLAAKAGADYVTGIDFAEISKTAANLVKANGLSEKVKILRGAAADLTLETPVDLLVSEWLGNFAFVEGMLDDVLAARDANLRGDGEMLPSDVTLMLAPMGDPVMYAAEGPGFWRKSVHGIDFHSLEEVEQKQGRAVQIRCDDAGLLAPGAPLYAVDLKRCSVEDQFQSGTVEFTCARDGVLDGFCGWFVAQLSPSVPLDTGPHEPETHWAQTYLAFAPRPVTAGQVLSVNYAVTRDEEERRYVRLRLEVDGDAMEYVLE